MKINRLIAIAAFMTVCSAASAQWRVGLTAGGSSNTLDIDTQFQYDWRYESRQGVSIGLTGQYDFNDWLAVRAELGFLQRGYSRHRTEVMTDENFLSYRNNYLVLPVMGSFSFGGNTLRGFLNAGVYGGYWMNSWCKGTFQDTDEGAEDINTRVELDTVKDQMLDFGYAGGVGAEWRIAPHWAAQLEARCWYSVVSKKKQYEVARDYQYNTTLTVSLGIAYLF